MSSSSDNRVYFDTIQDYFLERTGRGLMLSSRDLELLIDWQRSGASAQTVCHGIDEAVDRLNAPPRDLHGVRRFVESRLKTPTAAPVFKRPASVAAPAEVTDPWVVAVQKLQAAKQTTPRPELAATYAEVARRVHEARDVDANPWAVLPDLDEVLVRDAFDRLGEDERRLIDLEIEGRHGARLAVMNDDAREQTMLESRRRALEDRWGLVSLIE